MKRYRFLMMLLTVGTVCAQITMAPPKQEGTLSLVINALGWRNGTICLGTPNGLFQKYNNQEVWKCVGPEIQIDCMSADSYFVGNKYGLFYRYERKENKVSKFDWIPTGLKNMPVSSVASDGNVVVVSIKYDLFRSEDYGNTWTKLENTPSGGITCLAIAGVTKRAEKIEKIYVGTASMGLFSTVDNGKSWQQCNTGRVKVHAIAYSAKTEPPKTEVWISLSNGIFYSDNESRFYNQTAFRSQARLLAELNGGCFALYQGTLYFGTGQMGRRTEKWTPIPVSMVK
jgi:hypothetical protein